MLFRQIEVQLGERSYPIYIGRTMLSSLAPTLQTQGVSGPLVLITDSRVAPLYRVPIEKHLRHFGFETQSIIIPPGEQQKSLLRAGKIFSEMLQARVGRRSAVLALGGGVIGDLAGFVAATYQRGVTFVQLPTTLLAQVDSSVGGKVAVNHPLGKNMIGAFYQPALVWIDVDTLGTLPLREIVCGLGEVVKYGIALDGELFAYLENNLDTIVRLEPDPLFHVLACCLEIKASIVRQDEKETGLRSILNLGHTIGHALEAAGHYQLYKHGEAVLLGTIAECHVAKTIGMISVEEYQRIVELIRRIPLKPRTPHPSVSDVQRLIRHDKKSVGGQVRFVLPAGIGKAKIVERVDPKLVTESLRHLWKLVR